MQAGVTISNHSSLLLLTRNLCIELQLAGKFLAGTELLFATDASDELDAQMFAIQVAIEFQQVYLYGAMHIVVDGRSTTNVEHTLVCMVAHVHTHGIYSVGRDEFPSVAHLQVSRRKAQGATYLLAVYNLALDTDHLTQLLC